MERSLLLLLLVVGAIFLIVDQMSGSKKLGTFVGRIIGVKDETDVGKPLNVKNA